MKSNFDYSLIQRVGDLTTDGVAVYDLQDHKFLYTNQQFLNMFQVGKESATVDTNSVLKYVLTEDIDYLKSRTQELLSNGSINTTEFRIKLPGNETRHLCCDVMMLDNMNVVTAFVKDVSQNKTHEDFLIKYTAQKDIILDMLTHNLSGPLQLSKDVISTIQKGYNENKMADVSKLIGIMQENTQQCIDIVNDFLREEHLESSFTHVRKTRFDVIDKINVMLVKLREINKEKVFNLHSEHSSLFVNSDAVKFFQVIHNVLSNAIKFTRPDGVVDISVQDKKDFYIVKIKDNGIGMSKDIHPNIFLERVQGREGLRGEKSKGLGLYIAHRLVKIIGGNISFTSEENKGTEFTITLPKE